MAVLSVGGHVENQKNPAVLHVTVVGSQNLERLCSKRFVGACKNKEMVVMFENVWYGTVRFINFHFSFAYQYCPLSIEQTKTTRTIKLVSNVVSGALSGLSGRSLTYLNRIGEDSGERVLTRVLKCEQVRPFESIDHVVERIEAANGICLGLFSHALGPEDPLVYVSVNLSQDVPRRPELVGPGPEQSEPSVATFWSINSCERGLTGQGVGLLLLTRALEHFQVHQPTIDTFVTLSPVHGFTEWLRKMANSNKLPEKASKEQGLTQPLFIAMGDEGREKDLCAHILQVLDDDKWYENQAVAAALEPLLTAYLMFYLDPAHPARRGRCPVAHFHLGNGAILLHANYLADTSPDAIKRAMGFMVNYKYVPEQLFARRAATALSKKNLGSKK